MMLTCTLAPTGELPDPVDVPPELEVPEPEVPAAPVPELEVPPLPVVEAEPPEPEAVPEAEEPPEPVVPAFPPVVALPPWLLVKPPACTFRLSKASGKASLVRLYKSEVEMPSFPLVSWRHTGTALRHGC